MTVVSLASGVMDVLDDMVAGDVVAVEILVKRLLATSGMTIGAPLRTRKQKAAKLLFYILHAGKRSNLLRTDG